MGLRKRAPASEAGNALRDQFAHNVRRLRTQRGLTQLELAHSAGLGRSFVSQLESGHFSATLETVAALARALGVTPSLLLSARF